MISMNYNSMIIYLTKESYSMGLYDIIRSYVTRPERDYVVEVWAEYIPKDSNSINPLRAIVRDLSELDRVWSELASVLGSTESWTERLRVSSVRDFRASISHAPEDESVYLEGVRDGWNLGIRAVQGLFREGTNYKEILIP